MNRGTTSVAVLAWVGLGLWATPSSGAPPARPFDLERALEIVTTRSPAVDLNDDGTPDLFRRFHADGSLSMLRADLNGDGAMDLIEELSPGGERGSQALDRNRDGKLDQWITWSYLPDVEYRRVLQLDTDYDGRVDRWVTEEYDPDPRLLLRETFNDLDRDGAPDAQSRVERTPRWAAYQEEPVAPAPPAPAPPVPAPSPGATGEEQALQQHFDQVVCEARAAGRSPTSDLIRALTRALGTGGAATGPGATPVALTATQLGPQVDRASCDLPPPPRSRVVMTAADAAVRTGTACLLQHNPALAIRYLAFLVARRPEISCAPLLQFQAERHRLNEGIHPEDPAPGEVHPSGGNHDLCGLGEVGGRRVILNKSELDLPTGACPPPQATIFHEFLHNLSVGAGPPHVPHNPTDGVYSCEFACFPPPGMPGPQVAALKAQCGLAH
ncbi:MAG: hypothetical protein IT285_11585 [Bdellovibrionales bacterium]|nr:hypothetical protein [Bdellovibrionales bacterium]